MKRVQPVLSSLLAILLSGMTADTCVMYPSTWWYPKSVDAEPLYRFVHGRKSPKIGYIDNLGNVVYPPEMDKLPINYSGEFHNGLLKVGEGVYVGKNGLVKFKAAVSESHDFTDGLAAANIGTREEPKWGYLDLDGRWAIAPQFAFAYGFSGGFAFVNSAKDGFVGLINAQGDMVLEHSLALGGQFREGRARVFIDGPCFYEGPMGDCGLSGTFPGDTPRPRTGPLPECKFAFIDEQGRPISDLRFDDASNFSEGLAAVQVGKLWGYIDRDGTMAILPQFRSAFDFSEGLAAVSLPSRTPRDPFRYGYIDRTGTMILSPEFKSAGAFRDGRALIQSPKIAGGKMTFIDRTGQQAFPLTFRQASPFFQGLAHVYIEDPDRPRMGRASYINPSGKIVFWYVP